MASLPELKTSNRHELVQHFAQFLNRDETDTNLKSDDGGLYQPLQLVQFIYLLSYSLSSTGWTVDLLGPSSGVRRPQKF